MRGTLLVSGSGTGLYREIYRPWGSYDLVYAVDRFQVKWIDVNPRVKLSVQLHHCAEHEIIWFEGHHGRVETNEAPE